MLTILLNWLYLSVTTFCTGFLFAHLAEKKLHIPRLRLDGILMAGIVIATVYAQIFSLFSGVGLGANLGMAAACIVIVLCLGSEMRLFLRDCWKRTSKGKKVVILLLFFAWAYFTSRGYLYYDSDLYHAQSIRWIEEYGVVPGLGNLHERFAYNSASFALSALYSMKFIMGYSMHGVNGYLAFLLSVTALDLTKCRKRGCLRISDYAMVGAVYYLTTLTNEVVSPSSDLSVMCILFFIVIRWLELLEEKRKDTGPYALLCVLCVYAISLKVTAALLLLLVILPACRLIQGKKWKEILVYLSLGVLVAAPWVIRTVVISGWLLYPFPYLDLFQVDWKMPVASIEVDAAQIKAWGRALYNVGLLNTPFREWFPNWFRSSLSSMEKILVLADLFSLAAVAAGGIFTFWKKRWQNLEILLVLCALSASYLFWQLSAPLVRYGYAYILLLAAVTGGWILTSLGTREAALGHPAATGEMAAGSDAGTVEAAAGSPEGTKEAVVGSDAGTVEAAAGFTGETGEAAAELSGETGKRVAGSYVGTGKGAVVPPAGASPWKKKAVLWLRDRILTGCLICYGLYKLFVTVDYAYDCRLSDYYIRQQGYGVYEVYSYELEGETFYAPVYGDRVGYDPFPSSPVEVEIELRGQDLKKGFRPK